MATLQERLALMAGLTINEADFPRFKTIKIALADVGLDDQPDDVIMQFAQAAVEQNDVLTIEDWRVNRMAGTLEFDPMLSGGEVSPRQIAAFRSFAMDFLSNPENIDTYESVQERKLTPAELEKREEVAKAIEKDQPGIDKSKKMAIATAQAKKISEDAVMESSEAYKELAFSDLPSLKKDPAKARKLYNALKSSDKVDPANKTNDQRMVNRFAALKKHIETVKEANYDDEGNVVPDAPLPQGLAEIARKMGFATLDTRNSDGQDFKEVAVWAVKDALLAAYNLGKSQGTAQATPAEQQPQSGGLPAPTPRTSADHQQAA